MKGYILTAIIALGAGVVLGTVFQKPRIETRTEYVDRVVTKRAVERVRVRTTTKPDGTRIEERTETHATGTTTDNGRTISLSQPLPRWTLTALAGVETRGGWVAGGAVSYRLVGPLQAGGWLLGGPNVIAGGVSLGVTW